MTQAEFDQLPLLLRLGDVRRCLPDWPARKLERLPRRAFRRVMPGGRAYYFRVDVARLGGFAFTPPKWDGDWMSMTAWRRQSGLSWRALRAAIRDHGLLAPNHSGVRRMLATDLDWFWR